MAKTSLLLALAAVAVAAPAPAVKVANYTESFESLQSFSGLYSKPDAVPGAYNALYWANLTSIWQHQIAGAYTYGQQPYDYEFYGQFDASSPSKTAGASAKYNGSCVDFFSLHNFAFSCWAVYPIAFNNQTYQYENGAKCTIDLYGYKDGLLVGAQKYFYDPGPPRTQTQGLPIWYMTSFPTSFSFQSKPLDLIKFSVTNTSPIQNYTQFYGAMDALSYTVYNKTICPKSH